MKYHLLLALLVSSLVSQTNTAARADWDFTDDGDVIVQSEGDWPVFDFVFRCDHGVVRGSYLTLDAHDAPLPANKTLKLAVLTDAGTVTFALVQDDDRTFTFGAKDARLIWKLASTGTYFKAGLTDGKKVWWRGEYDVDNYADVKDKLAAFCPANP
jgi:hypothetical protein